MIHSKLHKFLAIVESKNPDNYDGGEQKWFQLAIDDARQDPLYIFDNEIVQLLIGSEQGNKSIVAMADLGLCHLPYPKMTLQFQGRQEDGSPSKYTWFVLLREVSGVFWARTMWFNESTGEAGICEMGTRVAIDKASHCFQINAATRENFDIHISAAGVRMAVLMTHISGLDREHIEAPEKLNKAREKRGEPKIAPYSYVHVARVYDRDGVAHERTSTGRHMPVHMRSGHIRNQVYGRNRAERKLIWIPPVLVNYRAEDGDKPVLEKRIVA